MEKKNKGKLKRTSNFGKKKKKKRESWKKNTKNVKK
jgi:hypothetical protein